MTDTTTTPSGLDLAAIDTEADWHDERAERRPRAGNAPVPAAPPDPAGDRHQHDPEGGLTMKRTTPSSYEQHAQTKQRRDRRRQLNQQHDGRR